MAYMEDNADGTQIATIKAIRIPEKSKKEASAVLIATVDASASTNIVEMIFLAAERITKEAAMKIIS
jgi:hypothetical protein